MGSPYFACAGEALIDLIQRQDGRFEACLGGAVFNFALALARQGVPTAYANPLSEDTFGQRFRARLEADAVTLLSARAAHQPTSLAVVTVDAQGKPNYAFHRSEVADRSFDVPSLLAPLGAASAFHVGCLALVPADIERYVALIQAVAGAGGVISVDANMRPVVEPDPVPYIASVKKALQHAHIIKVSDEDLLHLDCVKSVDDEPALIAASRRLMQDFPKVQIVALTLGANGAVLITKDRAWRAAPPKGLAVADTVGAGDCFIAALDAALWKAGHLSVDRLTANDEVLADALARAVAGASVNITRVGCDPATWGETSDMAAKIAVAPI